MHLLLRIALLAVAVALASPAGAMAAGKINTNVGGDITYEGDGGANVVTVASVPSSPTSMTLVIAEAGITEGTDSANICVANSTNSINCTFAFTQRTLRLNGGAGADEITVNGPATTTIAGDAGEDKLTGGDGTDTLLGGTEADRVDGAGGDDYLDGGAGGDVVNGGPGEDRTAFDLGDGDTIDLGAGRDTFFASNADGVGDVLRGGDGSDTIQYVTFGNGGETPFSTIDLERGEYSFGAFGGYPAGKDSLDSVENAGEFLGSSGPDVLIGNARSNVLAGGSGGDKITGGPGTDTLLGDKSFSGVDQIGSFGTPGADTFDSVDGFEDQVECGGGADTAVADQFDGSLAPDCETIDRRQADPFGIPPAQQQPQTPGPGTSDPGTTDPGTVDPTVPRDVSAPKCVPSRLPKGIKRAAFVKRGIALTLDCDEPARVEATASLGPKGRATARTLTPGDVLLGEKTLDYGAGKRKLAWKVPRSVRKTLGRRATVRLRITVTDRAGNAATTFASVKVR